MKTLKIAIIGTIVLLSALMYFTQLSLAITAEKGNIAILGREENGELKKEKIDLHPGPGIDFSLGQIESGVEIEILDTTEYNGKRFHNILVRGETGGQIGCVSEDYIYEILPPPEPPQE